MTFFIAQRAAVGIRPTNGKSYATVRAALADARRFARTTAPDPVIVLDQDKPAGPGCVAAVVWPDGGVDYKPGYGRAG